MAAYGVDIDKLAERVASDLPVSQDPSADALVYLAMAYAAVRRLEGRGADLQVGGKPLITPHIERAYREMLYVRPKLPVEWLDTALLSRFGRLVK